MTGPSWKLLMWEWFRTHHGVVDLAHLARWGCPLSTVRRMVDRGELITMAPGVYRSAHCPPTGDALLVAACLRNPSAMAAFTTAGRYWGLRKMGPARKRPHVLVPHGRSPEIDGIIVHRCRRIDRVDIVERPDGIRLTSPPRTIFDVGDMIGDRKLASALEQVLDQYCTFGTVVDTLIRLGHPRRPGSLTLGRVLSGRRAWQAALQSDLESRVLDEMRRQSLPDPVTQFGLILPRGREIHLDFAWPDRLVAVEVDHPAWHAGAYNTHRDKNRDRLAATLGWLTVRLTDLDVNGGLREAIGDIAEILHGREIIRL